jgi:hypothetical protein
MILYKDKKVEADYDQLALRNPRLSEVIVALCIFAKLEFNKDIVLTCIHRTPEENKAVGGIENSPHLNWEAADLRSSTFTQPEIKRMLAFLNCFTFRNNKQTAICHEVAGGAAHFHLQVARNGYGQSP